MRNKYRIVDLDKGVFAEDIIVYAKNPIEAVREYCLELQKDPKDIVRDYESKGRWVVYSSKGSFVYKERKEQ